MIGVALTSYHRPEVLKHSLEQWHKYLPKGALLIVVQDVAPVAKAKNLCLKLLESRGVTDYFLADDDCWPISPEWYKPYIGSGESHMMYQFDLPGNKLKELHRDANIVTYDKTRGAMLYIKREVLDVVGGFDERYFNSYEHPDFSWRIFNAGLTTYRAMDVVGSDQLLYCLDQDQAVKSSIGVSTDRKNALLYKQQKKTKDYMEYR